MSKKSLSLFLRNNCERQFIFSLYGDDERVRHKLPPRDRNRFALGLAGEAGYEWQAKKVAELQDVFGDDYVYIIPPKKGNRPGTIQLCESLLKELQPYQFVVEALYQSDTETFRSAINLTDLHDYFGNPVSISETQPDIIQVLPPLCAEKKRKERERDAYRMEVLPSGETLFLNPDDRRIRLRIIDIKLTSEPGAYYFAEVVYYSMSLAAWLIENKLNDRFVVIAAPAVWPGSHEASELAKQKEEWRHIAHQPTPEEMAEVLEKDIEVAPFDVYAPHLRRFLSEEFPLLLAKHWPDLDWHVGVICKGCEFLGYPWRDKEGNVTNVASHCWPSSETTGHLSRVVGLTRGSSEQLRGGNIRDVKALAQTDARSPIFDEHQGLRAKRSTFPQRAAALVNSTSSVISHSGGDALMPEWPDLHVYIFIDYDLSSAFTASIAISAFWVEPLPYGLELERKTLRWPETKDEKESEEVFLVDWPRLEREREEFLKFLRHLRAIFKKVIKQDEADKQDRRDPKNPSSTYQIYLWDEAQRKHLIRLVGRHLPYILNDPELRDLAWLFPSPELLQRPEDATRQSPITLVSTVIDNTVAVPVPHHHRLFDVAQHYHPAEKSAPSPHPLYEEPMSDLIPAERIHEWWRRIGTWSTKQDLIIETARKKIWALSLIVRRLEQDLKGILSRQAAPPLVPPPRSVTGVSPHGRLWLEYTRLNASLQELDAQSICAMPPHEREARLKSARLRKRLSGMEEINALALLNQSSGKIFTSGINLFIYKMRDGSQEVNARPGDFAYALSPELQHGFLDKHPYSIIKGTELEGKFFGSSVGRAGITAVTIEAIDRVNGLIALRGGQNCCVWELERLAGIDFSQNVILDPIPTDFLTSKVELTVRGIGYPQSASEDERVLIALGMPTFDARGTSQASPAAEVLWEVPRLHGEQTGRNMGAVKSTLEAHLIGNSYNLDESQWAAWEQALSLRFSLIWGPPGTGKSRTLRAIILGTVLDALAEQRPLRLLITANTYTAIDNVLLAVERELEDLLSAKPYELYRVQSKWHPTTNGLEKKHPSLKNLVLNTAKPMQEIKDLQKRLEKPEGIMIVGCPPQQLHNLAIAGKQKRNRKPQHTIRQWFDLILLDEASQMDVAQGTLVFTKLADGGSCVLAGDDLQLPPIYQADPPEDLEYVVGSAYNYFRRHHKIEPGALNINYRSNSTIVEFTKIAGYSEELRSYSPDLRLNLLSPVPVEKPQGWPESLYWTSDWKKFLDPDYPCVCYVYEDKLSSQFNDFEASSVASLLWLLQGRMADKPKNERRPDSSIDTEGSTTLYTSKGFWGKGVGVVTPHRAQMAKIIFHLQQVFSGHSPEDIRGAVDTVERFQGQERDVIIASFGLGDPDIIGTEDEFLFNLNRFNVLTSRARAKLIVLITRSLLGHLSNDAEVLEESRLLKQFAEFCGKWSQQIELGFVKNGAEVFRRGILRRR
ncbi:MAG: AAA domain-containing protein [Pyrinomonadaceae bacterium]